MADQSILKSAVLPASPMPLLYLSPQFLEPLQFKTTNCVYRSNLVSFPCTWLLKPKLILKFSTLQRVSVCMCTIHVWSVGLLVEEKAGSPTHHFIHFIHLIKGWQEFFKSFSQWNIFSCCQLYFWAEIEAIPSTLFRPSPVCAKIPFIL